MIARLRRMIAEPTTTTYSDLVLAGLIEARPLTDVNGLEPFTLVSVTLNVPTYTDNSSWLPTYDLNAVAGELWAEKANLLAGNFDFNADGASYQRSQAYEQAMKQSRYYLARRAVRSIAVTLPTDPADPFGDE